MPAFESVVCYPNALPFEPTEANVDAFVATLAAAGVTHVQINYLPDSLHPEQLNQPDNVYLWFASFGAPLDLFVSSSLNRGLYPEMYLERNRHILLRFAAAARRHGLKPLLYLCEPRFVPERFFQKHPTLRGPRVDNPVCSKTPLYALCTDRPEVLAHYRELMTQMMDLVPDLALATIFTSDSGAGFDYNPDTYAGPNGAGFNRRIPLEKRVSRFLTTLLEAGRTRNPKFTVHLTSGFPPAIREEILAVSPPGVIGSVYGLYDWAGGLEEHWGYHQAIWGEPGPKWNIRNLDRAAARADRFADMQERFQVAARGGRAPLVHTELPTTDYPRPLRYTPHPFETIRVAQDVARLGAKNIVLWGNINPPALVPHDVNAAAFRAINANITADPDAIVTEIAREWVGAKLAPTLVEAWRICDRAWTQRPLWNHCGLQKPAWPGPLVPDVTALRPNETAYYQTIGLEDLERIQGIGYYIPYEPDERNRRFVLHELYEKQTLPGLEQAAALLAAHDHPVFREQRDHIRCAWLYQRSHYNWYEAGSYLTPGHDPQPRRSFPAIVDDELAVTREFIALLDGRADRFLRLMATDTMPYNIGPSIVDQLRARIAVMEAHRLDPPRNLNEYLKPLHDYQTNPVDGT